MLKKELENKMHKQSLAKLIEQAEQNLADLKAEKFNRSCQVKQKDKREWRVISGGGSKIRSQVERLKHLGARRGTADCFCQKPARTG